MVYATVENDGAPMLVANRDPSMAPMPEVTYSVPKAFPLHHRRYFTTYDRAVKSKSFGVSKLGMLEQHRLMRRKFAWRSTNKDPQCTTDCLE